MAQDPNRDLAEPSYEPPEYMDTPDVNSRASAASPHDGGQTFAAALRSRGHVSPEPAVFVPRSSGRLFDRGVKRKLPEPPGITRGSEGYFSGVASWSQPDTVDSEPEDDPPLPPEASLRVDLNRSTKWGRCPDQSCLHSMKPHLLRSGPRRGHLALYCTRWWNKGPTNGRECWGRRDFDVFAFLSLTAG